MAFKKVTVNSSRVAGTLSDYPSYFNPSRAGVTTTAESNSGRVYADSGKVVEWARDATGVNECHTKIPSITTTTELYYDYDGIRADYAPTDTYGRNAVWTNGYRQVYHMDGLTDSTSSGIDLTNVGSVSFVSGKLGNAADGQSTNTSRKLTAATSGITGDEQLTGIGVSFWFNAYNYSKFEWMFELIGTGATRRNVRPQKLTSTNLILVYANSSVAYNSNATSTWYLVTMQKNGGNLEFYRNGGSPNTASFVDSTTTGAAITVLMGEGFNNASNTAMLMDEFRVFVGTKSSDWVNTEYNNQNDEPDFWGTWTDVGGGFTPTPMMHMMGMAGGII